MSDNETPTPLTDAVIKSSLQFNPHPLCFGPMEEMRDGWQYMASRIEQHARYLERQLAEALEQNRVFRIAQKACEDCEGMSHIEFQECKKDTERLEHVAEFGFPDSYCPEPIAYPAYEIWKVGDQEFEDFRQAIDKAMEESE